MPAANRVKPNHKRSVSWSQRLGIISNESKKSWLKALPPTSIRNCLVVWRVKEPNFSFQQIAHTQNWFDYSSFKSNSYLFQVTCLDSTEVDVMLIWVLCLSVHTEIFWVDWILFLGRPPQKDYPYSRYWLSPSTKMSKISLHMYTLSRDWANLDGQ